MFCRHGIMYKNILARCRLAAVQICCIVFENHFNISERKHCCWFIIRNVCRIKKVGVVHQEWVISSFFMIFSIYKSICVWFTVIRIIKWLAISTAIILYPFYAIQYKQNHKQRSSYKTPVLYRYYEQDLPYLPLMVQLSNW